MGHCYEVPRIGTGVPDVDPYRPDVPAGLAYRRFHQDADGPVCYIETYADLGVPVVPTATWNGTLADARTRWGVA